MGLRSILRRRNKIEERRAVCLMFYSFCRGANMERPDELKERLTQFYKTFDVDPELFPHRALNDEYYKIQKAHLSGSDESEDDE